MNMHVKLGRAFLLLSLLIFATLYTPLCYASDGDSESQYYLNVQNRTPEVERGGKMEIGVSLNGYGTPSDRQLSISWDTPAFINKDKPGILETPEGEPTDLPSISDLPNQTSILITVKALLKLPSSETAFVQVPQSWLKLNDEPSVIILNVDEKAPYGKHVVTLTFLCGSQEPQKERVEVNIKTFWDKTQGWLTFGVASVAAICGVITAIFTIVRRKRPSQ
jgi:hypothetical protein